MSANAEASAIEFSRSPHPPPTGGLPADSSCLGAVTVGRRVFHVARRVRESGKDAVFVICPGSRAEVVRKWLEALVPTALVLVASPMLAAREEDDDEVEAIAVNPDSESASSPLSLLHAVTSARTES